MTNEDKNFQRVVDQIGYLLNSKDAMDEVNKLVVVELTINPKSRDLDYRDVLTQIIIKLINFYDDKELERLWTQYLMNEEDEYDEYDDDEAA